MRFNNSRRLLGAVLPPNSLDEIALGIHQVEINTVVDEVVLALLDALGGREVHPIFLAHLFDLVPGARETNEVGVELGEIGSQHGRRVTRGVAGDEDGQQRRGGGRGRGAHDIDHAGHLIELFGADIRAVREAEIDLF
jgi:hypothetical protein